MLLIGREQCEIPLGRRGQRLDHILQRVLIDAVQQIKDERRDLGIGKKERSDVPLAQILAERRIVGKVPVVYKRFMKPHKGVCSAGCHTLGG
jgi:hypothetical protein